MGEVLEGTGFDLGNPIGYGAAEEHLKVEGENERWSKVAFHTL